MRGSKEVGKLGRKPGGANGHVITMWTEQLKLTLTIETNTENGGHMLDYITRILGFICS